jgi:4-hydroxybenzoate polyprenyltransferase
VPDDVEERKSAHVDLELLPVSLLPEAQKHASLRDWLRALRVHHWSKNVLVFVPALLAHRFTDWPLLRQTLLAFLLMLVVTSCSYLINDLTDLEADRLHPTKRSRAIARGAISPGTARAVSTIGLAGALALGFLLDVQFALVLLVYAVMSLSYSFGLKQVPLLDVFVIGALFTARVVMGTVFVGPPLPVWLLTFAMFFFFSLAMAKRHAMLVAARADAGQGIVLRGYRPDDQPLTLSIGVSSGFISMLILVLYLVDEAFRRVGYSRPDFLWAVVALIAIWMGRIWLLAHRGGLNDDPVSFALRDRWSQLLAAATIVLFFVAL